jgi:hypothetical protein
MAYKKVWRQCTVMALLLTISMSFSSCEPLRKKFTRQKKKDQQAENSFIPVLEPQEYPAPKDNPIENYKQHYSLVKVWYKDLWTSVEEKSSDKHTQYVVKQVYAHIEDMRALLSPDKQTELDKLKALLKYYDESLNGPRPLRNMSRVQSDLRAFDRQLRKLSPDKVRRELVSAPESPE